MLSCSQIKETYIQLTPFSHEINLTQKPLCLSYLFFLNLCLLHGWPHPPLSVYNSDFLPTLTEEVSWIQSNATHTDKCIRKSF